MSCTIFFYCRFYICVIDFVILHAWHEKMNHNLGTAACKQICRTQHKNIFREAAQQMTELIRSNKMQQYSGIYLLQIYSARFGCLSHPSSGVHKTVSAASGTGHSIWATTLLQRGQIRPRWRKFVALIRDITCTRGCRNSFLYSWWWVGWTPETCRINVE